MRLRALLFVCMFLLALAPHASEVLADSTSVPCGSGTCIISATDTTCTGPCNSTAFLRIYDVGYISSNKTLQFTLNSTGTSALANVTIPKAAVENQNQANLHVYLKGVQLQSSMVKITSNSTSFFTAFNVTFASPVNAAISLGIIIAPIPALSIVFTGTLVSVIGIALSRSRRVVWHG